MRLARSSLLPILLLTAFFWGCAEEPTGVLPSDPESVILSGEPAIGLGALRRSVPRSPCHAPPYRQFDFWVGDWDTENPSGTQVGTDRLTIGLDGCLVEESWTGAAGFRGRSLNAYDARTGQWHQSWLDVFAQHLRLAGGLEGESMVLSGDRIALSGVPIRDEITWTPLPTGVVRQFWEITVFPPGGDPFAITAFDGRYFPSPDFMPAPEQSAGLCTDAAFDELDFWLGSWRVEGGNGLALGESEVAEDLDNCLIEQVLSTPKGYEAKSFLGWDPRPQAWFQTFVDSEGQWLLLSGGLVGDRMVLIGKGPGPGSSGKEVDVRVTTWADAPDRLVQTWETSKDGGASWKTEIQLVYTR